MPVPEGRPARPRLAVLANAYKRHLHAQHIADRILDGYGWGGGLGMYPEYGWGMSAYGFGGYPGGVYGGPYIYPMGTP